MKSNVDFVCASYPTQPGANNRFVIAQIGVGGMGKTHLKNLLRFQDEGKVRIAAAGW
jgi:hypothetical protein